MLQQGHVANTSVAPAGRRGALLSAAVSAPVLTPPTFPPHTHPPPPKQNPPLPSPPPEHAPSQNVHEYEDKEFANVSKEDLKLAGKDEQEKKQEKKLKVGAAAWWGDLRCARCNRRGGPSPGAGRPGWRARRWQSLVALACLLLRSTIPAVPACPGPCPLAQHPVPSPRRSKLPLVLLCV